MEGYSKRDYSEYESSANDKDAYELKPSSKENEVPKTITSNMSAPQYYITAGTVFNIL